MKERSFALLSSLFTFLGPSNILAVAVEAPASPAFPNSDKHNEKAGGPGAAMADDQRQVLASFPADPYSYELGLQACDKQLPDDSDERRACSFSLGLLHQNRVLDQVGFAQPSCGPVRPTSVSLKLGADRRAKAWVSEDEHCDVEIAALSVDLGPGSPALLVTELQGFEYRYRSHWLYTSRNGKLVVAWVHEEDALGTHWTTTTMIPGISGGHDIAFIDMERAATGVAFAMKAERLHLDPSSGRVLHSHLPDASSPLFVLSAGRFRTQRAANRARQKCPSELVVMRSRFFPGLKLPTFFFGAVLAQHHDAEAALAAFRKCSDGPSAEIIEYHTARASIGEPHGSKVTARGKPTLAGASTDRSASLSSTAR
jgi:hypothetical protein